MTPSNEPSSSAADAELRHEAALLRHQIGTLFGIVLESCEQALGCDGFSLVSRRYPYFDVTWQQAAYDHPVCWREGECFYMDLRIGPRGSPSRRRIRTGFRVNLVGSGAQMELIWQEQTEPGPPSREEQRPAPASPDLDRIIAEKVTPLLDVYCVSRVTHELALLLDTTHRLFDTPPGSIEPAARARQMRSS